METLEEFIQNNPDHRELKRALAVQMKHRGYSYRQIREVLQVSLGFISNCNRLYQVHGIQGLKLNYWGTQGYLQPQQKQELLNWLAQKDSWLIEEVIAHVEECYGVVYQSLQSYYSLLFEAGFSFKKAQATHPSQDEAQVEQKKRRLWIC